MKTLVSIVFLLISIMAFSQDAIFYKLPDEIEPIIDGNVDLFWNSFEEHEVALNFLGEEPSFSLASWKAAWNNEAIFILVEVNDDYHCDEWCASDFQWMADKVEIYFDVNDTIKDGLGASASNTGHIQVAPTWQQGYDQHLWVITDGLEYEAGYKITGSDYIYEYKINLDNFKNKYGNIVDPAFVDSIGFDVYVVDRDSANDTRRRAVWSNNGDINENWMVMDDCGTISFDSNIQPALEVSSARGKIRNNILYNLGSVSPETSKDFEISLKNFGDLDLSISSLINSGTDFSILSLNDSTLSPGETQILSIRFLGNSVGAYTDTIIIESNDGYQNPFKLALNVIVTRTFDNGKAVFRKLPDGVAPVIDGNTDDLWNDYDVYSIEKKYKNENPTIDLATWQAVWNDTAIFIKVKVIDDKHCDLWCSGQEEWLSDKVEIYFDINKKLKDGRGPNNGSGSGHFQCSPAWQNGLNQYYATEYNWMGFYNSYAYNLNGSDYVYEYAIRINTLTDENGQPLDPNTVDSIGFDICITDRDIVEVGRQRQMWSNIGTIDEDWFNMDDAGRAVFTKYHPTLTVLSSEGKVRDSSTYSLGYAEVNSTKEIVFTLRNDGEEDLTITDIITSGDFSSSSLADPVLSKFETQPVTISFTSNAEGIYTGKIQIVSNDPENDTITINLIIGNGLTVIQGGEISGTWYKNQSPYYVLGNVIIPDNKSLTIESGVNVIFNGYYYLQVEGVLRAIGAQGDSILFTVNDTAGYYNLSSQDGSWQGIYINNNWEMNDNDSSILDYCIIEYAKAVDGGIKGNQGGGMYISNFQKLMINHCTFRNNIARYDGGGLFAISFSDINIYNSTFIYNQALEGQGGGIMIHNASKPTIYNCVISYNKSSNLGGGMVADWNTICYIYNTMITNNESLNSNAGGLYLNFSNSFIVNCIIANNEAGWQGGGLTINNCEPYFYNSNICYNRSRSNTGGGLIEWGIAPVKFINCIFWGNIGHVDGTDQLNQVELTSAGQPNFYNCIIQGGIDSISRDTVSNKVFKGDSVNVYTEDLGFIDAPAGVGLSYIANEADWNVSTNSITINKGQKVPSEILRYNKDIYHKNRILHSFIDIGAAETHISSFTASGSITEDTYWTADTVYVTGDILITDTATLTIAPGTVVEFQGHYKFKMQGRLLSIGTPDAMIKFTINDPTGFEDDLTLSGSWHGISLNDDWADGANFKMQDNDSTIFEYTLIEYAKNLDNDWLLTEGGGIQIDYVSKLRISHCIIRNNRAANGGGILIHGFANPIIEHNQIYNNYARYAGGGIQIWNNSNPLIYNNIISNNESNSNGGGIMMVSSKPTIINNIICNNFSYYQGCGVYMNASYPVFSNNTIVNNNTSEWGGGLYIYDCSPEIYNTIIWGNGGSPGEDEVYYNQGNPVFYNCIIENGMDGIGPWWNENEDELEVYNLITNDPHFVSPSLGIGTDFDGIGANWAISNLSAAINNGTSPENFSLPAYDYNNKSRINNDIIDIGAYENQGKPVEIVTQPIPQKACVGDTISLSFSIKGVAEFQWLKNVDTIPGANSNTYTINNATINDEGAYSCIITDGYGTTHTNNALITIQTVPYITVQPENTQVCLGNETKLEINASSTLPITYNWYKDDTLIALANNYKFNIANAIISDAGDYYCQASNACGSVNSYSITLVVNNLPNVNLGNDKTICWNSMDILDPGNFELYRWNDFSTDRFKRITQSGEYFVRVTDINGCKNNSDTINITIQQPYIPEIFLVTVDHSEGEDGKNQIVWDKPNAVNISSFKIYKETTTADDYALIGTIPYNSVNYFIDQNSNPKENANRYKMSIVDNCGETEMSKFHKTIHLTSNVGAGAQGGINLIWNHYEGFTFGTYEIYRGTTKGSLELLAEVPSNLNSYSDLNPPDGDVYYMIDVVKGDTLYLQNKKKTSSGPYSRSSSNMEDNRLRSLLNAPTDILLSNTMISENREIGSQIGILSAVDEDEGDEYIFTVKSTNSGNNYFNVKDQALISKVVFNYEDNKDYTIRLLVEDLGGNTFEKEFTINILDEFETGIDNKSLLNILNVYPIPATDYINVKYNAANVKEYYISIINSLGSTVYFNKFYKSEIKLELSDLPVGLYILQLKDNDYLYSIRISLIESK